MMARPDYTVTGEAGLRHALDRLAGDMRRGAETGQLEAAETIADEWARDVPVDTGEYQRSVGFDADGAFATADHAPFVEFGTSTHSAQPAAAAAAEMGRRRVPDQIGKTIEREIR
ncbi:MAG: hypothetical protein ACRD0W_00285 [Acidimicrobiales bacterium]